MGPSQCRREGCLASIIDGKYLRHAARSYQLDTRRILITRTTEWSTCYTQSAAPTDSHKSRREQFEASCHIHL